jgi:GT2 family glycosyltransferase
MDRVLYHYRYRSDRTATQNGKAAPTVMGIDPSIFHVVIPSAKPANLRACVRSIMTLDPGIHPSRIVVVDDGASAEGTRQEFPMLSWLPGKKPFVFARNVNLALSGLSGDAVVLNDDARLMTRFGLSALSYTARAHANLGIVSARVLEGQLRNPYEAPGGMAPEEWTMFPFVCTYLKRRTIERVGFLDERFTGYGYDDNDYCLRVRQVGLKLGQYNGCSVLHGDQQTSTYRQMHDFATLYETNRRIYEAKWARKT